MLGPVRYPDEDDRRRSPGKMAPYGPADGVHQLAQSKDVYRPRLPISRTTPQAGE